MMAQTAPRHKRPFPGMRPFQEDEDDLFFGQQPQIDALVERLGSSHLVAVLGESGCGKSSLVKAGLIPHLRGGRSGPGLSLWHTAVSRPAKAPIRNLAEQLAAADAMGLRREDIEETLRSGSFGLVQAVKNAGLPRGHRVLVVIDQFEELFRFSREAEADTVAKRDEASLFVKLLLGVTEAPSEAGTPIYVVLTMRSEYLGDCALFFGLAEAINRGLCLLPKMTRWQMEEAIRGPLTPYGADIDNDLLQCLLNETDAAQQDGLPMLQHALRRIWDAAAAGRSPVRLQLRDLQAVKPDARGSLLIEKHLNEHLDLIFGGLTPADHRTAERLFKQLGEYDHKGRLVRRSCDLPTVAAVCGVSVDTALRVANNFRSEEGGRTFLMPPDSRDQALLAGEESLDISHEALLRRWEYLRKSMEQEARDADEFCALAVRANKGSATLRGAELSRVRNWMRRFAPSEPWARRYCGTYDAELGRRRYDYEVTINYWHRSLRNAILRRVAWAGLGLALCVAVAAGVFYQERERDRGAKEKADAENARNIAAKNLELQGVIGDLTKADAKNREYARSLEEEKAKVLSALQQRSQALDQVQDALRNEKDARNLAESQKAAAQAAQKSADAARIKEAEARKAADESAEAARLAQAKSDQAAAALDKANKQLEVESRRRDADLEFRRLEVQPPNYRRNPSEAIGNLLGAIERYQSAHGQPPPGAVAALRKAFALSRMAANDDSSTKPVLLTFPNPAGQGKIGVVRQGDGPGFPVSRQAWMIQRGIEIGSGEHVFGGAGGFVSANHSRKDLRKDSPGRKVFPFAVTGLGLSTDAEWIVAASSSGDMRVIRREALASDLALTRGLLQFASAFKLVAFLATHRFQGEYPVREFAVSMRRRPATRRDLDVATLTESGRLLIWSSPGPIGKQLARLERLTVEQGRQFYAIATNPATQTIWAAGNGLGRVNIANRSFDACGWPAGGVTGMAWSADGTELAVGHRDGQVRVLRLASPESCEFSHVLDIAAHNGGIASIVWYGRTLATGSVDGSARLWNLAFDEDSEAIRTGLANLGADLSQTPGFSPDMVQRLDGIRAKIGKQLNH